MSLSNLIEEKSKELALKHAEIIENECKKVIDKFNCQPEDLIIEYHENTKICIKIKGSEFVINNVFYWNRD